VAKVAGPKGGAESTRRGDPFLLGKFLRSDNERRRDAENPVVAIGYSGCEKTIRVDTIRKVAIIAVGGKIGKPLFFSDLGTLGTEGQAENTTHLELTTARPATRWFGDVREEWMRGKSRMIWFAGALRRDASRTIHVRLAPGPVKGWMNP
jgi:hypothetical protein